MAGHMSGLIQQQATPSRAGHLSCLSLFNTLHSLCGTISAVHIPLPGAHQLSSLGGVMSASCVLAAAVVFALFQVAVCGGVCGEDQHWAFVARISIGRHLVCHVAGFDAATPCRFAAGASAVHLWLGLTPSIVIVSVWCAQST